MTPTREDVIRKAMNELRGMKLIINEGAESLVKDRKDALNIFIQLGQDILDGHIGFKPQPYWYLDEKDVWHRLDIDGGKYYIDGVLKTREMMSEEEIEKIVKCQEVSFYPRRKDNDKTYYTVDDDGAKIIAHALVGHIPAHNLDRGELV